MFLEENLADRQKVLIHIWLKIKIRVTKCYDQILYHLKNHYGSYVMKQAVNYIKLSFNVFVNKMCKNAQVVSDTKLILGLNHIINPDHAVASNMK